MNEKLMENEWKIEKENIFCYGKFFFSFKSTNENAVSRCSRRTSQGENRCGNRGTSR